MASAKKNAPTAAEVAAAFRTIADWVELTGGISTSTAAPSEDVEKLDEDEVKALPLKELRALAEELELDEQKAKKGILEEMAAKGMFEDSEEEDEDDEPEDDEANEDEGEDDTSDDDEDEEELSREDLEEMDLKELRDLAKEEGHPRGSYIKADKDAIIDLLLGDEEEDEEDDDEDDGDSEELSEEEIRAMSLAEVKELAKELGVKISPAIAKNRKKIADKILDEMSEEE